VVNNVAGDTGGTGLSRLGWNDDDDDKWNDNGENGLRGAFELLVSCASSDGCGDVGSLGGGCDGCNAGGKMVYGDDGKSDNDPICVSREAACGGDNRSGRAGANVGVINGAACARNFRSFVFCWRG